MKKIIKQIAYMDLFSTPISLSMGSKSETSTKYSIIISKIVIIFLSIYFCLEIFEVFTRKTIKTSIQTVDTISRGKITLNSENFRLAFRIEDQNGNNMKHIHDFNEFFSVNINYAFYIDMNENSQSFKNWSTIISKPINYKQCEEKNFLGLENYFVKNNLNRSFCLESFEIDLEGYWYEAKIGYLTITLEKCKNTSDIICRNSEEISNYTNGSHWLSVYYENYEYNLNDYSNPIQKSIKNWFIQIDDKMTKFKKDYFKSVTIITDTSLFWNLWSIPSIQYLFKFNGEDKDFSSKLNTDILVQYIIYSSDRKDIVNRNYYKLIEAFSAVGGISKFFMIIGIFLTYKYNIRSQELELINEIYSFQTDDKNKNYTPELNEMKMIKSINNDGINLKGLFNKDKTRSFNKKHSINFNKETKEDELKNEILRINEIIRFKSDKIINNNENQDILKSTNLKFHLENIKKSKENDKNRLNFNFFEILLRDCIPIKSKLKKAKQKMYKKSSLRMKNYLDVFEIVKKIQELEKLKFLLLNKKQLALFNFLAKPLITDRENPTLLEKDWDDESKNIAPGKKLSKYYVFLSNKDFMIKEILNYYEDLVKTKSFTKIDKKLFEWLDQDIQKSIDEKSQMFQ